ncbi:hypothetical protein OsI_02285 [Oryza sativa Indica Group]|nr:hypothetical protein OsI_02285 [Oryza sativa Indica Group]
MTPKILTIGIADEHFGAVVRRAGRNITEIILASGARIKISDRDNWNIRSYSGSRVYDNAQGVSQFREVIKSREETRGIII